MTTLFQSAVPSPSEWECANRDARELLLSAGAILPEGFVSTGIPQINLVDLVAPDGAPFDAAPFRGRMLFAPRSGMHSGAHSPFPHGPVRLTLVRWGADANACGRIDVGQGTELNGTSIVSHVGVRIGAQVLFGPEVVIMDCDGHAVDRRLTDAPENLKMAPVEIGDHAWIGFGAIIMKGVRVGHHAVVAARAIVTRDVPAHAVVAGNPARVVKQFGEG